MYQRKGEGKSYGKFRISIGNLFSICPAHFLTSQKYRKFHYFSSVTWQGMLTYLRKYRDEPQSSLMVYQTCHTKIAFRD